MAMRSRHILLALLLRLAVGSPVSSEAQVLGGTAPTSIIGQWTNPTPTGETTHAEISRVGTSIAVHMWGECTPTDCDWGQSNANIVSALDPQTGLYFLRARYYDPTVGRF